jgi:hypothetical protein
LDYLPVTQVKTGTRTLLKRKLRRRRRGSRVHRQSMVSWRVGEGRKGQPQALVVREGATCSLARSQSSSFSSSSCSLHPQTSCNNFNCNYLPSFPYLTRHSLLAHLLETTSCPLADPGRTSNLSKARESAQCLSNHPSNPISFPTFHPLCSLNF